MALILLVDDDPALVELTRSMLETCGYEVVTAADARQGLSAFVEGKDRIELVITDVSMPGMDGASMARRMVSVNPALPVLFVSGSLDRDDVHTDGLSRFAFLAKPFTGSGLVGTVAKMLVPRRSPELGSPHARSSVA